MGMPVEAVYTQLSFRGRTNVPDPAALNTAFDSSDAALNADFSWDQDTVIRVRWVITQSDSAANTNLATEFRLQYNKNNTGWNPVAAQGTTLDAVRFADSNFSDGDNTTQLLSSPTSFITGDGLEVQDSDTITFSTEPVATEATELEAAIEIYSGQTSADDTIDFRWLYSLDDESPPATTMTYTQTLTITVTAGATTHQATATLSGAGTVAAVGQNARLATATLAGAGTVTAAGQNARLATATLAGAGTVTAAGQNARLGTATLAGAGTVAATPSITRNATSTLAGVGTVTAAGTSYGIRQGTATLAGVGTVTATGSRIGAGGSTLAGVGTVTAAGQNARYALATLAGQGTLTAAGQNARYGTVTMAGAGTVTANGQLLANATATLPGVGSVQAVGTLISGSGIRFGTATLAGLGTITADGQLLAVGAITIAGQGTVQAIGTRIPGVITKEGGDDEREKPRSYEYQKDLLDIEPVQRPTELFEMRMRQKAEMEAKQQMAEHEAQLKAAAKQLGTQFEETERQKFENQLPKRRRGVELQVFAEEARRLKTAREQEINQKRLQNLKKARAAKRRKGKK